MDLEEKKRYAKEIIENPIYNDIIRDIKDTILHEWEISCDKIKRENCWFFLRAINSIDMLIKNYTMDVKPEGELNELLKELSASEEDEDAND